MNEFGQVMGRCGECGDKNEWLAPVLIDDDEGPFWVCERCVSDLDAQNVDVRPAS
jgi:hypothetical protein